MDSSKSTTEVATIMQKLSVDTANTCSTHDPSPRLKDEPKAHHGGKKKLMERARAQEKDKNMLKRKIANLQHEYRPTKVLRATPPPNAVHPNANSAAAAAAAARPPSSQATAPKQQRAPLLLRQMWLFCKMHRPDLLPSLREGILSRHRVEKPTKSSDLLASVMGYLVQSWGVTTVEYVCRCIATNPPADKRTKPVCIDLTEDDDEDDDDDDDVQEVAPPKDHSYPTAKSATAHRESKTKIKKSKEGTTFRSHPCLDTLARAATMMEAPAGRPRTGTTPTRAPPVVPLAMPPPDILQVAVAYGFVMGRHHQACRRPLNSVHLWRLAAQSMRKLSPSDRNALWQRLQRDAQT